MTNTITIQNRIATVAASDTLVGGNTYPVTFAFDSEWSGTVYVRVRFGAYYYDIPGTVADGAVTANVQMPVGYPEVALGVFSETLQICTNEVRFKLLRGIVETGSEVVEFDSDLYDQWAGEVTELLTDDAFDGESTRPVQNAVLTAWKNTVALDANVVHKAGAETIAGAKTLTAKLTQILDPPIIDLISNRLPGVNFTRARIQIHDNGTADPQLVVEHRYSGSTAFNSFETDVYAPDRQSSSSLMVRKYPDHMEVRITPYYPVDANENPVPLAESMLVASGNIVVDPRIVHTTGTESIAGTKTFTNINVENIHQLMAYHIFPVEGSWTRYYTYAPLTSTNGGMNIEFWNRYNILNFRPGSMMSIRSGTTSVLPQGRIYGTTYIEACVATRVSDGVREVWIRSKMAGGSLALETNVPQWTGPKPSVAILEGDKPIVGEVYSSVVDLEEVE